MNCLIEWWWWWRRQNFIFILRIIMKCIHMYRLVFNQNDEDVDNNWAFQWLDRVWKRSLNILIVEHIQVLQLLSIEHHVWQWNSHEVVEYCDEAFLRMMPMKFHHRVYVKEIHQVQQVVEESKIEIDSVNRNPHLHYDHITKLFDKQHRLSEELESKTYTSSIFLRAVVYIDDLPKNENLINIA